MYKILIIFLLILITSACDGGGNVVVSDGSDTGTNAQPIIGNTLNAIGFAIGNQPDINASASIEANSSIQGCAKLVKIVTDPSADAKTESVFSETDCDRVDVVSVVYTSNDLVVKGTFLNVPDTDGNPFTCHLMAIPLNSDSATAKCIETETLGGRTTSTGQQWGVGLLELSDVVYYTTASVDNTKIKKWTGGSTVETIFTSSIGAFNEIYTSDGYSFLYFRMNPGVGLDGSYFYGNTTNGFNLVDSFRDEPIKLGNKLFIVPDPNESSGMTENFKKLATYNLDTGTHVSHLVSGLEACRAPNYGSEYFPIQLQWQSSLYSYWIGGLGFKNALCKLDTDGTSSVVDDTYDYERGWRTGDTVLLLSKDGMTPTLTKLDLSSDVYSGSNLLGTFGLLEVSDMREYLQGVALTGTDTFGNLTTVYYNATTDMVDATPDDISQFSEVVILQ